MKLAIDMLRVLYLININQPVGLGTLTDEYVGETRTEQTLLASLKRLQADDYISRGEPFTCSPKGLASLQSVKLYKVRDAGRLFHLKFAADSDTFSADERRG